MSRVDDLRDALGLDTTVHPTDVAGVAKIFTGAAFNPTEYFNKCDEIANTLGEPESDEHYVEKVDEAGQWLVEGAAETVAMQNQVEVSKILAEGYQHGDADLGLPPDSVKAHKLDNQIALEKNSENWHKNALLFTQSRLWALRAKRVSETLGLPSVPIINTIFGSLGLSYFVEGIVDLYTLGRVFFKPTDAEKTATPNRWERLKNMYHKGSRQTRLWNFRWGLGNLADLILQPILLGAAVALPMITAIKAINDLVWFVSDVIEEGLKCFSEYKKYNNRLKIIEEKIGKLESALKESPNNAELLEKLVIWERCKARALELKAVETAKCWRAVRVTVLLAVGMAMLLLPQFLPVFFTLSPVMTTVVDWMGSYAGKMTGAAIALFGGSVYGGLVRALWNKYFPHARDGMMMHMAKSIRSFFFPSAPKLIQQTSPAPAAKTIDETTYQALYQKLSQKTRPLGDSVENKPEANLKRTPTAARLWKLGQQLSLSSSQSAPSLPSLMRVKTPELQLLRRAVSAPASPFKKEEGGALPEAGDSFLSSAGSPPLSVTIPDSSPEVSPIKVPCTASISPSSSPPAKSSLTCSSSFYQRDSGFDVLTARPTPVHTPAPTPTGREVSSPTVRRTLFPTK